MNNRKKTILVIFLIILAFLLLIIGVSYIGNIDSNKEPLENKYRISDNKVELNDTKIITNDKLTAEHCLGDICVKDVKIYQVENEGRIEYTIINKGINEATDILKLNFGDSFTYVSFTILQPSKSVSSRTMFRDGDYSNVVDYTLEELTAEEKEKVVRH